MDRIKLLPDNVANQIAAGEVVNRPASVVKELLENALDAGATTVTVNFKDGGREMIQVIDNGIGMNTRDAIMAFERHATSKIREAADLYKLSSFGFRGEALASIASVAEVELRTRTEDSELGLCVAINGGKMEAQSEVNTPKGTQFIVRNLFYNVPARRRFLKEANVEARHITGEFQRVALCNQDVSFVLYNNGNQIYNLPATNLRQRIIEVHGRSMAANLLDVSVDTSIVKIEGYIGRPTSAKKSNREQYMFVNGRYFRSAYFHKAIVQAYSKLIATDTQPSYFVYLTIDPERIDVNVHPSKTEIKFDDESSMWQIFNAAVRESLGRTGAVPMMDFEMDNSIEIPVYRERMFYKIPDVSLNRDFNPFNSENDLSGREISNTGDFSSSYNFESGDRLERSDELSGRSGRSNFSVNDGSFLGISGLCGDSRQSELREYDSKNDDFEEFDSSVREFIYGDFESDSYRVQNQSVGYNNEYSHEERQGFDSYMRSDVVQGQFDLHSETELGSILRLGANRCALSISGQLLIVDIRRAHFRVLFERYLGMLGGNGSVSQQLLFPEIVDLAPDECVFIDECIEELTALGFDLQVKAEGRVEVTGIPTNMSPSLVCDSLHETLNLIRDSGFSAIDQKNQAIASSMAARISSSQRDHFDNEGLKFMIAELIRCTDYSYTPTGLPVLTFISGDEIDNRFI